MRPRSTTSGSLSYVTTFLLSTLFCLSFPILADAAPSPLDALNPVYHNARARSHDTSTSSSQGHTHTNDSSTQDASKRLPPDPHWHDFHAAPKVKLDDESIHLIHHFPPSYLAVDFRLDNDSAIFGEEFDESWDPDAAQGHARLMAVHALGMVLGYFGALPIGLHRCPHGYRAC